MNSKSGAFSGREKHLPPHHPSHRWRRWLTALTTTPMLVVAPLNPLAAETTVTLAGSFRSLLGCSADWMAECAATELQPTDQDGHYSLELAVPAGRYEYKVALNKGFDSSYGLDGGQDNIPLSLGADSRLRFTFDASSGLIQVVPLNLRGSYSDEDAGLMSAPARQAGAGDQFYFVMTDCAMRSTAAARWIHLSPSNKDSALVWAPVPTAMNLMEAPRRR